MKIAIIGAGVMGSGIAQVSAMAGHQVSLFDLNQDALSKALKTIESNLDKGIVRGKVSESDKINCLSNLTLLGKLEEVQADLIIEAVVERLDVKIELFNNLAKNNGPSTIYATNTSSIPITQIAAGSMYPERVIGIHFFNPAHIMKLVEIISGAHTSEQTREIAETFVKSIGKIGIKAADAPGFIVNRVARNFYVEGLKTLEERVASYEVIDELMESSGFKMGPFRLMDLIGVETNYSVTTSMYELFKHESKFRPNRIQKQKVDAGHHGRKSGKGFYNYE